MIRSKCKQCDKILVAKKPDGEVTCPICEETLMEAPWKELKNSKKINPEEKTTLF